MDSLHRNVPKPSPHYTVFIRLPFPRDGFEDPAPVQWDSAKDKALWKIISKTSNSKDLDWPALSAQFGVTLSFLLQQSAWLYERHFEGMRMQMKKLGASAGSAASSPKPPSQDEQVATTSLPVSGAVSMVRTGSKDSAVRQYTSQSARATPVGDMGSTSGTPRPSKPLMSRNTSTSTVTQSRAYATASKQSVLRAPRGSAGSQKMFAPHPRALESSQDGGSKAVLSRGDISESDYEPEPASMMRSTTVRRPPIARKPLLQNLSSDGDAEDDDDDDGSGDLPFASFARSIKQDPAATLRNQMSRQAADQPSAATRRSSAHPDSSASSTHKQSDKQSARGTSDRPGPLSPRHRAQLEQQLSLRYRRSGSEGSPSMGSSFSDLDDVSVTQSALEDALMSNMQYGSIGLGLGSRTSSLREGHGKY